MTKVLASTHVYKTVSHPTLDPHDVARCKDNVARLIYIALLLHREESRQRVKCSQHHILLLLCAHTAFAKNKKRGNTFCLNLSLPLKLD